MNKIKNIIRQIKNYFTEAFSELKKVKWPTRNQILGLTVAVVLISGFVGLLIAGYDIGLLEARKYLLGESKTEPTGQETPIEIPVGSE